MEYRIEFEETYRKTYVIEANSAEEALAKFDPNGEILDEETIVVENTGQIIDIMARNENDELENVELSPAIEAIFRKY